MSGGTSRSLTTNPKNSTDPKVSVEDFITQIHPLDNFIRHFKEEGIYNTGRSDRKLETRVAYLRGCESAVEHGFGHGDLNPGVLYVPPHGLLGSKGDVKFT